MKKIILLSLLVISVVCGKSLFEEIRSEFEQKKDAKAKEQKMIFFQNEEAMRLNSHCQGGNGDKGACRRITDLQDKSCQNGLAMACGALAMSYLQGNEQFGIKIDENMAKYYADKVCALDGTFCYTLSASFSKKNKKLSIQYAEKACEMGESIACLHMVLYHNGTEGISENPQAKNPQKVKYYQSKLCKAGYKEACE